MLRRLLVAIPAAFLFALFAASVVSAHEGHDHSAADRRRRPGAARPGRRDARRHDDG